MENLQKRKQALQAKLESITTKVSETVFNIGGKGGGAVEIDIMPRNGLTFSPGEFADYRKGTLALIVGFGQCSCSRGRMCEEAKEAPMMFVLIEGICGITSVLKKDLSDYEKI